MHLNKGSEVEVTSDDDGFRGVWYVGKIVQPQRKSDDVFVEVEYNELVSEEDESKKLCERVHVKLVRPLPPAKVGEDDVFELGDVVDVFHNDGWWVGVVEEVVGENEFKVLFDDPPDRLSVKRQDVRLHLDWVQGKWEKPLKKNKNKKEISSRLAMLSNHPGNSKRQNGSGKKQQPGKSGASTEKDTCMNYEIIEKECNAEEVDMSVKALKGVPAKNCETPPKKEKRKIMDQDSSRPAMLSNHIRYARRLKTAKKQAGKSCTSTEKKDTSFSTEILETDHNAENVKEVNGVSAKSRKTPLKKDQMNKSMDQEMHTVDSTNGSTQGDVSSKRKRGKQIGKGSTGGIRFLQKRIMEESCVYDEAEMNAVGDCQTQTELKDKFNGNHFQPSSNDSIKATADKKHTSGIYRHSDSLSGTTIVPFPEDQANEKIPSVRVKRPKNKLLNENEGMSKLVEKCQNASQGNISLPEINHVKDVDMLMDRNPGDVSGDQVSNTTLQVDKTSPTGSDASRTLPSQSLCANANGKLDDFGTTPVATHDKADNTDGPTLSSAPGDSTLKNVKQADKNSEVATSASVSIDNMENCENLPFVKCSPLWKTIESMEIYKRIQQKPHFSPLIKMPEETREGFAIAHMVNFSNLVERITKLQFSDPITVVESIVGALDELEHNGFDIEAIRACLTQLLSKKQTGEELHKECQNIENEISDTLNEREKVDEEITQLNQQMNELAAKLGDAVTRKEMKERVISTLKSKQDVASKDVQGLQLEFENIVSSFL